MVKSADFSARTDPGPRPASIAELRSSLRQMEHGFRVHADARDRVSTGISALDSLLPDQGLLRGTLSEWIATEPGNGTVSLAMHVAGHAQRESLLVVVDVRRHFYPPAFAAAGVRLENMVLLRPKSPADGLWAMEQALRCPGIGAVLCQIDRLKTQEFRRLQLAAEAGTAVGLLIRPASAQKQSGWADVRLQVSSRPSHPQTFRRRLEVRCVYARGALADRTVELEICDETGSILPAEARAA